jgi:hypothetical protein
MSREEFQGMVSGSSEKTKCYESGFRGGMLFLDFVLGAPLIFIPIIIDGVGGKFTAYYYDHEKCEELKAQERDARLSRDSTPAQAPAPVPAPAQGSHKKKVTKTVIIETTETDGSENDVQESVDDGYEVLY